MSMHRMLAGLALAAGLVAAGASARAATLPRFTAIDLGPGTTATALNASGQVTGAVIVDGTDRAFVTGADGVGLSLLPTLGGPRSWGTAINDRGQVVGDSFLSDDMRTGLRHAFVTGANGQGITDLGTLGGIWAYCNGCSRATGINNDGVVVGEAADPAHNPRIFVAEPADYTVLRTITLGNGTLYGGPINNQGWIAGTVNLGGDYTPLLIRADGGSSIPLAHDTELRQPAMMGINDAGQVVGDYFFTSWQRDAFVTDAGGSNLRRLRDVGANGSTANDINNAGWVVGVSYPDTGIGRRAFLAAANGSVVVDLNTLVSLPDGMVLNVATAINEQGQIVANSDLGHAWLLTPETLDGSLPAPPPVPEPATWALWLAGLALPLLRRWRRH
ncbi:PEP-CTERM sorting domain-containing protein [Ideonella sp. DXS22W]|uniref:PEP-CTERM sorting domain-containing protein n=1 Tax=Pseudaquabacterium inlustre TaxID=2984192 RepID=A0ABU9CMR1_9BURK